MAFFMTNFQKLLIYSKKITPFLTQSSFPYFFPPSLCHTFHRTLLDHTRSMTETQHLYRTHDNDIDFRLFNRIFNERRKNNGHQVNKLVNTVKKADTFSSVEEAVDFLEKNSKVEPNEELVVRAIGELREEWKMALIVFKWGEKRSCLGEDVWELMVWVLGNCKKFNIAWGLIREMYRSSVDTRSAMLVMIDRYAAVNNPSKAIHTFEILEKYSASPDMESFHTLLSSLCKWGNMEEAEEFMLSNKKLFPLETNTFNIILNGWCNVSIDVLEAKRVWKEMSRNCILPNGKSYTYMISCFSKVGNLFDSLRLYDEMKKRRWVPGLEVCNSLIYVFTCENCFEQAMKILEKMKEEGVKATSLTYNSMIGPLCDANKFDEARNTLAMMIEEKIDPTVETYHSFLKGTDVDETTEILNHMKKAGIGPNKDTFILIFRKFLHLKQPENALKFQDEMKRFEIEAGYESYCVLVEGLVNCGSLIKAREVYDQMKMNGFVDDPKLKKLLNEPNSSHIREKVPFRVVRANKDNKLSTEKSSGSRLTKRRKKLRKASKVS